MADAITSRRGLCLGLRRLPGFKGSLSQAVRRSSIVAHSYSLVERPVNGLCYRPTNLRQLEMWQLRLDIGHCWIAYENSILQTSQGYNRYTGSSRSDYQCDCAAPRNSWVNCDGLRLAIHIKVLVLVVLLSTDQKEAIYSLPPSNR